MLNREVKVRAWDKLNREMIHDHLIFEMRCLGLDKPSPCRQCAREYLCKEVEHFIGWLSDCDGWTMDLSTGLKSKSCKEIYEGDIWSYLATWPGGQQEYICLVRWNAIQPGFELHHRYNDTDYMYAQDMRLGEVIGNIHENPELLQQKGG